MAVEHALHETARRLETVVKEHSGHESLEHVVGTRAPAGGRVLPDPRGAAHAGQRGTVHHLAAVPGKDVLGGARERVVKAAGRGKVDHRVPQKLHALVVAGGAVARQRALRGQGESERGGLASGQVALMRRKGGRPRKSAGGAGGGVTVQDLTHAANERRGRGNGHGCGGGHGHEGHGGGRLGGHDGCIRVYYLELEESFIAVSCTCTRRRYSVDN